MEIIKNNKTYILICLVFIGFLTILPNNISIWTDELFTLNFIKLGVNELLVATAQDIHPPLYYLLVKLFHSIFSFLEPVIAGKLFSISVFFGFLLFTYNLLKSKFNDSLASSYVVIVLGCKMMHYCFEIRMYTLASSLVLLAYIYGYLLINETNKKNLMLTNIYVLASMYTHYYAILALVPLLLYLAFNLLKSKFFKIFFGSLAFQIIAYLPWAILFICSLSNNQSGLGSGYYLNFKELVTFIVVFFSNSHTILTLITMILYLTFILCAFKYIKDVNVGYGFICLMSLVSIFLFGNLMSLIFDKFFTGKYLLIAWNLFAFSMAIFLSKFKYQKFFISLIFVLNLFTVCYAINDEQQDIVMTHRFIDFLDSQTSVTCVGNYTDIVNYYAATDVYDFDGSEVKTQYIISNNKINGIECDSFNPAGVDMYVYTAHDYNNQRIHS